MGTLLYLAQLFGSLLLGSLTAKVIGKDKLNSLTTKALNITLYMLLFFMGVNSGSIENISEKLLTIGLDALIATVFVILGCIVSSFFLSLLLKEKFSSKKSTPQKGSLGRFKTPLMLVGVVILGFIAVMTTNYFNWFDSSYIEIILYVLLFFVGMEMVQNGVNLIPILKSPMMLLLPISTIVGTYLGALFIPFATSYTVNQSLALVSGFGWYSLSGILISGMGDPQLGAVSFLSNLMRESFAFLLIPLLASFSRISYSAVSVAGATSMDVTLPLLKRSLGNTIVPLAITHGVIMSLLAPLFIPLWL
ncbi:MAG: lysine exporter LysO family protein [Sphaerochaetaceae bacterium]|jgi:uncharacterized membrane protein YbjE (DUF340 family)